ncbi:hypothetical protein ACHAWU_004794 [Discostella pseudostelligera]|uniref:Uncharacterized protein n=1 Tax=Discostella pseudostelligera TaxID=259834 RepID=A0ABD3NA62_9STRA
MKKPFHKRSSTHEGGRGGGDGDWSAGSMCGNRQHQDQPQQQHPTQSSVRDDSTVNSGGGGGAWSVDGSISVTERIMNRMKLNLPSFGNIHFKNNHHPPRRSGSFGAHNNNDDISSMGSTGGGGGSDRRSGSGRFSVGRMRRKRFRSHSKGRRGSSSTSASVLTNSYNEGLALRGRTGRRGLNNSGRGTNNADDDSTASSPSPVEYSLAELRSMHEEYLINVMKHAGVPSEDITNAIHQASSSASGGNTTLSQEEIARRTKNALVALFVNSGCVKLVLENTTTPKERNEPLHMTSSEQQTATSNYGTTLLSSSATTASAKSNDSKRKSKLEKIAELKVENGNVRAENKSLKKLVKKLLGQLAVAIEERDSSKQPPQYQQSETSFLQEANNAVRSRPSLQGSVASDTFQRLSLRSVEKTVEGSNDTPPTRAASEGDAITSTDSARSSRRKSISSTETASPSSSAAKTISQLKQQLKKEKGAHEDTKFRLKTEIDILTNEVNGLQRELGHSLESLDDANEQSREYKESMNSLKRELRHATKKVKELCAEAEARDRLIETFSSILLKRIDDSSSGEEGGTVSLDESEVKMVEKLVLEQKGDSSDVPQQECVPTLE